ncbi:DinB family protein [Flavobacterium sp. KACC 22761]|uniref:DinB family protein n=1 Tax=Flavobacterium sp. KACC 22761 TaxID=3092665 RepID=UPI002A74ACB4|nr:DinB family protein [Flavobacterium sp. KACC 22761]WPO78773.1 DinB family protein [Flavobacterium sp. KACC 22761]
MDNALKEILWRQFAGSIDMLKNAVELCPQSLWNSDLLFGYNAFHTAFFLDYYLTLEPKGFAPPKPFSLSEFEDRMPERIYTKEEVLIYLEFGREKLRQLLTEMTDEIYKSNWENESKTMCYNSIEILLYNMRHVQHHTAQLNLLLRQNIDDAPKWVREAKDTLY